MPGCSACAGPLPTLADLGKLSRAGPGEFLARGLRLRAGRKTRHTSSSLLPRESRTVVHYLWHPQEWISALRRPYNLRQVLLRVVCAFISVAYPWTPEYLSKPVAIDLHGRLSCFKNVYIGLWSPFIWEKNYLQQGSNIHSDNEEERLFVGLIKRS